MWDKKEGKVSGIPLRLVDGALKDAKVKCIIVDEIEMKFIKKFICLNRLYVRWLHLFCLIVLRE